MLSKNTDNTNAQFDEAKDKIIQLLEAIIGKDAVEASGIRKE